MGGGGSSVYIGPLTSYNFGNVTYVFWPIVIAEITSEPIRCPSVYRSTE